MIAPGTAGYTGISFGPTRLLFARIENPNLGPDSGTDDLANCAIGSLFSSMIDGSFWSKVGKDANAPYGIWVSHT